MQNPAADCFGFWEQSQPHLKNEKPLWNAERDGG